MTIHQKEVSSLKLRIRVTIPLVVTTTNSYAIHALTKSLNYITLLNKLYIRKVQNQNASSQLEEHLDEITSTKHKVFEESRSTCKAFNNTFNL